MSRSRGPPSRKLWRQSGPMRRRRSTMADKVKLTLPMTDSKTPDWAEIEAFIVQSAAIEECRTGKKFVLDGYPFVTGAAREVLDRHISQALAAVDHRAYARGIEDAAKV